MLARCVMNTSTAISAQAMTAGSGVPVVVSSGVVGAGAALCVAVFHGKIKIALIGKVLAAIKLERLTMRESFIHAIHTASAMSIGNVSTGHMATSAPKPVATDLKQPNGIIGTPDGKTLYVADIGAGKTYAYDMQPGGELAGKRLFCNLGSDGMTLDAEGNVYLTGKGVSVFDKAGQQIEHLDIPEGWTANVTFGGTNNDLLFITASKSIYGARLRVKGAGRVVQK